MKLKQNERKTIYTNITLATPDDVGKIFANLSLKDKFQYLSVKFFFSIFENGERNLIQVMRNAQIRRDYRTPLFDYIFLQ